MNYEFIERFERYHLVKGNGDNSLSTYLRAIKAIYNKGILARLLERAVYPFTHYTIRQTPIEIRVQSIEDIRKIMDLKIPMDMVLFRYRNYFICSFLLYGTNLADMAHLKISDIINGCIKFRRKKTGKLCDIKTTDQLAEILRIYLGGKSKEDYIFPVIKRDNPALQEREISWERKRYNRGLKIIGEMYSI